MSASDRPKRETGVGTAVYVLLVAGLLPVGVLFVLRAFDVPLGEPGKFLYRYSPLTTLRLGALPPALGMGVVLAGGVWLLLQPRRVYHVLGGVALAGATLVLGSWVFTAPPQFRSQTFFNMLSPSHDGAFLIEALHVERTGVRRYLRAFPRRARTPVAEMKGTRVISNPPGATLLAVAVAHMLESSPALSRAVYRLVGEPDLPPEDRPKATLAMGYALALLLLWLLAAPLLFGVGRLFFPAASSGVFMVTCLFTPATFMFAPGKDPAQLLTVAACLYLWLLGWRRNRAWVAAAAGATAACACLVSLVHVWIALIVLVATLLATAPGERRRWMQRCLWPAVGGFLACAAALWVVADVNLPATAWATARSQAAVTRGEDAMPLPWQAVGIPLFLLFCGPGVLFALVWPAADRALSGKRGQCGGVSSGTDPRLGGWLLVLAAGVMLATVGFTNVETPRLWIPFVPLLMLGAMLRLPVLARPGRSAGVVLVMLVFLQVAVSAAQWSMMDAREAEFRLLIGATGGPRMFH